MNRTTAALILNINTIQRIFILFFCADIVTVADYILVVEKESGKTYFKNSQFSRKEQITLTNYFIDGVKCSNVWQTISSVGEIAALS